MTRLKERLQNFGTARFIILLFLVLLLVVSGNFGVSRVASISNIIQRFAMNGILVLSMVPIIQSGCGLNFGIPLGLVSGLLASVIVIELNLAGFLGFFAAMAVAALIGLAVGYLYGKLLNRIKGDEMTIATYVGFAMIFFMNMAWIGLPFRNPTSVQGYKGEGLRVTISLDSHWAHIFDDLFGKPGRGIVFEITEYINGQPTVQELKLPLGTILLTAAFCFLVWLFFRSKRGTAMTAVGSNPDYARAAGVNVNSIRTQSVMMSTALAAVGMVVYGQGYGFAQFYTAPLAFTFPTVAAILLGGASLNKASIGNVIIGTLLFQGVLTMTPSVINSAINLDISEVIRMVVTNGLIVYALTRKVKRA